jgi:hypothetical protein
MIAHLRSRQEFACQEIHCNEERMCLSSEVQSIAIDLWTRSRYGQAVGDLQRVEGLEVVYDFRDIDGPNVFASPHIQSVERSIAGWVVHCAVEHNRGCAHAYRVFDLAILDELADRGRVDLSIRRGPAVIVNVAAPS